MNQRSKRNVFIVAFAGAIWSSSGFASESLFAFTFGVDTLPKGQSEIALSVTRLNGQRNGRFDAFTATGEYERGVGDNLSIGVALGGFLVDSDDAAFGSAPGANGAPSPIIPAFTEERLSLVKTSVQRRILSPYTDGVGVALRTDLTFEWFEDETANTKARQYGIRPSLIFQKNYLDDTLNFGATLSANFRHGCEKSQAPVISVSNCVNEVEFRPSLGAAYRIAPRWNIGVEAFYRKRFSENAGGPGSLFAGPSIHYGDKNWYATTTLFWQAAGHASYAQPMQLQYSGNNTRLDNETEFRLRVGVNL